MQLANQIIDTLIIYTEAMYIYVLFACLVLHIDKWLSHHSLGEQKLLPPASAAQGLLAPSKLHHNVVPFQRKEQDRSYFETWTCKQLKSYLKDMGYTRLNKLRKATLVEIAKTA